METAPQSRRVGLVVDALPLPAWQDRLCGNLRALADVTVIQVMQRPAEPSLWRRLAARVGALQPARADVEARKVPDRAAALAAAQEADVDLVVDCTAAGLDGAGAPAFRFGLWSLRQKDGRPASAPYAFLRDMASRAPDPAVSLVRDDRVVLQTARPQVRPGLYVGALNRLLDCAAAMPARALAGQTDGPAWTPEPARPLLLPLTLPRVFALALGQRLWARLSSESWVVGVIDKPIAAVSAADLPHVRWIGPWTDKRYWADPFGVPDDPTRILVEELIHTTEIGTLKELTVDGDLKVTNEQDVAVSVTGHLSYPYMYVDEGVLYCIPESNSAGRAVIHRAAGSTARWEPSCVALDGVRAVDSSLFFHGGLYWLAYTDEDRGPNDTLFLAWSERLEGPWHRHRLNPVKIDARSSRPAGTVFRRGDALMRPAQDCSRTYGGAIVLNRVTVLTPDDFAEEPVEVLRPLPGRPAPDGLHNLGAWGERTLIDGKREWINPWVVRYRFGRKLGKLNPFRGR